MGLGAVTTEFLLTHLGAHKCVGLDGICPKVMRELAEKLTKMLSII